MQSSRVLASPSLSLLIKRGLDFLPSATPTSCGCCQQNLNIESIIFMIVNKLAFRVVVKVPQQTLHRTWYGWDMCISYT